jgi:hypothetical protein
VITFKCGSCGAALKVTEDKAGKHGKCPKCAQPLVVPIPAAQPVSSVSPAIPLSSREIIKSAPPFIGGNEELKNYVLGAKGISRTKLNVIYLIGVFVFGWLVTFVWKALGRPAAGWAIIVVIAVLVVLGQQNGHSSLVVLAAFWYGVSWLYANFILSKYQRVAKRRIKEIDGLQDPSTDLLLEKGLLQGKVLWQHDAAISVFSRVRQAEGGHPQLLNLAGVQLCACERYKEAKEFFSRAIDGEDDQSEIKIFTANRVFAEEQAKGK